MLLFTHCLLAGSRIYIFCPICVKLRMQRLRSQHITASFKRFRAATVKTTISMFPTWERRYPRERRPCRRRKDGGRDPGCVWVCIGLRVAKTNGLSRGLYRFVIYWWGVYAPVTSPAGSIRLPQGSAPLNRALLSVSGPPMGEFRHKKMDALRRMLQKGFDGYTSQIAIENNDLATETKISFEQIHILQFIKCGQII